MKLLTTVYKVEDPLIGSLEEIPETTAMLVEKRLEEKGRFLQRIYFDEDEKPVTAECCFYDEQGVLLGEEEYESDCKTVVSRKDYTYNEAGYLTNERRSFYGEKAAETFFTLDVAGYILEEFHTTAGEDAWWIRYRYHPEWKGCCVYEEHSKNGSHSPMKITREWQMKNGKPFLFEEQIQNPEQPYDDRIVRHYDPKTKENGVAFEVYNGNGDFLEEQRHIYNSKDQLIFRGMFDDDAAEAGAFYKEEFEYDSRGNLIRKTNESLSMQKTSFRSSGWQCYRYDEKDRITHDLTVETLLIYEYEEVPDDFVLF